MRKLMTICLIMAGSITLFAKDIKEFVVTTHPPMSCQNCENRIKGNLRFEKGVKKIETYLKEQRVVVTYDADKTNEDNLEAAFGKLDYKVTRIDGDCPAKGNCTNGDSCPEESKCTDGSKCQADGKCTDCSHKTEESDKNTGNCCRKTK